MQIDPKDIVAAAKDMEPLGPTTSTSMRVAPEDAALAEMIIGALKLHGRRFNRAALMRAVVRVGLLRMAEELAIVPRAPAVGSADAQQPARAA